MTITEAEIKVLEDELEEIKKTVPGPDNFDHLFHRYFEIESILAKAKEVVKLACTGMCCWVDKVTEEEWDKMPKNQSNQAACPNCHIATIVADDNMYEHNLSADDGFGDM